MSFAVRNSAFAIAAGLVLFGASAHAVTLNWSAVSWPVGTAANPDLKQTYYPDAANSAAGITVEVSGSTGQLTQEIVSPYPLTPAITTDFQALKSLCIAVDLATNSQSLSR